MTIWTHEITGGEMLGGNICPVSWCVFFKDGSAAYFPFLLFRIYDQLKPTFII